MSAHRSATIPPSTTRSSTGWLTSSRRKSIPEKRKKIAQEADYRLQQGLGRPIIYHMRAVTCWSPQLKGVTLMSNSQYNGWRMEDWWFDR